MKIEEWPIQAEAHPDGVQYLGNFVCNYDRYEVSCGAVYIFPRKEDGAWRSYPPDSLGALMACVWEHAKREHGVELIREGYRIGTLLSKLQNDSARMRRESISAKADDERA
jgi:predicted small metal-binding protein